MMGWTDLPYNQKEIVADILQTAKDIKKKFDNFVVLGIGVGILRRNWRRGVKITILWGEQMKRELDWRDCWKAG